MALRCSLAKGTRPSLSTWDRSSIWPHSDRSKTFTSYQHRKQPELTLQRDSAFTPSLCRCRRNFLVATVLTQMTHLARTLSLEYGHLLVGGRPRSCTVMRTMTTRKTHLPMDFRLDLSPRCHGLECL